MKKVNLIAIAIVTLGLVMASNAFGQRGGTEKRPDKNKPDFNKTEHSIKPMHAELNEVMIDGTKVWGNEVTITGGKRGSSETSRTSKSNKQDKLGNFEIQDLKATPKQVQPGQNSGGTSSNQKLSRKPKSAGILAALEGAIHAVKGENKAPTSTGDQPELQRKKLQRRSTQKRQHKP